MILRVNSILLGEVIESVRLLDARFAVQNILADLLDRLLYVWNFVTFENSEHLSVYRCKGRLGIRPPLNRFPQIKPTFSRVVVIQRPFP